MKKILAKIAGIITIFAMSFSPVLATNNNQQGTFCHVPPGNDGNPQTLRMSAWNNGHQNHELDYTGPCQGDDDNGDDDEDSCEEVSTDYKSSTSTQVDSHNAVLVTQPVNAGWTASITGADWIWSEADVLDSTVDTTKEFTQTFTFEDAPTDVVLDIAADNSYVVKVNGVQVGEDAGEFNYRADGQDQYTIPASAFVIGSNTVTFIVKNWGLADSTPQSNPAGLMYKFTVNDCTDDEDDNEECDEEESDCEEEENDNPGACDEIYARVNVDSFYNENGGNVTSDSYVGSNSNDVADGEWFQLHNGTNYIIDPIIDGYQNVPGLAIQRMNGQFRVLLYGGNQSASIPYHEYIKGTIELSNALVTSVTEATNLNSKLEDGVDGELDIIGYSGNEANFEIQVDKSGSDSFFVAYESDYDEDCDNEETACEYNGNLLVNGGFESPIAPAGGWDEYDSGTPGLGWNVAWNGVFAGAPAIAKLELHRGVNGWVSDEGSQHAELDADWGYNNNEQASVKISQTVTTVDGGDYALSYAFSPRPGTVAGENVLQVYVNGSLVNTHGPVAGVGNTFWTTYTVNFEGTGSDVIEFRDAGTPNTLGTLLDDVKVNCVNENDEPEVCTQGAPLYARVKINTLDATKWRNWNGGNLNAATPFFVGGNNPAQHGMGGNVYMGNEWFPLTNGNGTFINDADIAGYSNVPGVAVQRMNGAIRVVLYGNHTDASGGKELAAGSIELSTNASARLLGAWDKPNGFYDPISNDPYTGTRLHDATVNDLVNPMDSRGSFKAYINQYDPRFDNVGVNSDLFQFHLVATSGTDGFYARYNYDDMIEVPCGEVNPQ